MKPVIIYAKNRWYGAYLQSLLGQMDAAARVIEYPWKREDLENVRPGLIVCEVSKYLDKPLWEIIESDANIPAIIVSASPIPEHKHDGKVTFFTRPLNPDSFMEAASNHYYGEAEPFHRKDLSEPFLIGNSPRIREIRRDIRKVSDTDLAVLLLGETGTGKGVAALSLHNKSSRHRNQFMEVNCANVPHSLLESELFGYRKGAFTGAWQDKSGKFEEAANGTVFLDEISEIPPQMQAKLLHVLQDGEFSPVGSVENVRVNVRIVAATNANVGSLIKNGLFRKDLYYRLAVIHLHMPPLKERKEDILPLTSYFLEKYSKLYKKPPMEPSQKLLWNLEKHEWPGNVRELENTIKTYVALENEDIVLDNLRKCMKKGERTGRNQKTKHDVSDNIDPISLFYSYPGISLREITDMVGEKAEKTIIKQAVNATKGNKKRSAELLGVSYKSILSKMKTYGI